jgi:miniconductance mechanosensitive channel
MNIESLQAWVTENPLLGFGAIILASVIIFLIARFVIARALIYLATRTDTKYDDIAVRNLRPFRIAWAAPLLVIYFFAYFWPDYQNAIEKTALLVILWLLAITFNALLSALNEIYESSPSFSGVSIQGYLDIVKILVLIVVLILSISLISGQSPVSLLTGLGALTAVLLLVFRDTILSIVASIQISTHDMIKEGDWIEVPSYDADGDVINMDLHTVKVQNWDKTISMIPTYKMIDVAYKNWRGMQESGGRRIKRSISIDMASIRFCDKNMVLRLGKIDLIHDFLEAKLQEIQKFHTEYRDKIDSPLDGPQITNVEIFRAYVEAYLRSRDDLHQEGLSFLVRALAPSPSGLPIEAYVFTKTTDWFAYEKIQAEIFDHLLAAASYFDLRVFQEPTGLDFANLVKTS